MRKRPWPVELDSYSTQIGENFLMVQGPGGNTSYKDGKVMWVKASGTLLSDANDKEIFTAVDQNTGDSIWNEKNLRPSIEKDFHLLIPFAFVIHTHSFRAISMAIESGFGSKADDYPEIAFIPYARPGAELCISLSKLVDFNKHKAAILQNHGFLTWGNTMEEAHDVLVNFESELLITNLDQELGGVADSPLDHPKAITPDYAVFLSPCSEEEILAFTESNLWKKQMYLIARSAARQAGLDSSVQYLTPEETYSLQNWESEKFRFANNK
jgi:rhamnose utilization protein RhaD (predicted bifunctional aldolase and dehydrogenase)